jgi:diguanylate cyclase (GGDEF)-like protein
MTGLANSRNLVRHLERLTYMGEGSAVRSHGSATTSCSALAPPEASDGTPMAQGSDAAAELQLPPHGPFSVVMLDLDRFKEVNDTLGHLQGDELLMEVARTLSGVARAGDVVCRYAGDEFVLLLPRASREQAEGVAGRVREAVDAIPPIDGKVKIGISVGVATFPYDGTDGRTLLHVADQRMYEDKFCRRQGHGGDIRRQTFDVTPTNAAVSKV